MLTLQDLSKNVAAYRDDRMALADFADWFEDNSSGAYEIADLREACIAVDAAFSEYYFDHIGEAALKLELANAVRPFARVQRRPQVVRPMLDIPNPWKRTGSSNRLCEV
jgi:hypothetical protein